MMFKCASISVSFKSIPIFLALAFAILPVAWPAQHAGDMHWSYGGADGPDKWGKLNPTYATCSLGHAQSPIDINNAAKADLPPLKFAYKSVPLNIIDNGHTIQVNYPSGSTLTVGDETYSLKQFHFHHPSEEQINGRAFELVAHLVHADDAGHLAVVALLLQIGSPSQFLETLWKHIPEKTQSVVEVPAVNINVSDLLPPAQSYYTFTGSLTTPPCTEGVTWYVLKEASELSAEQVKAFAKIYPNNARPVQPLYGRKILETK